MQRPRHNGSPNLCKRSNRGMWRCDLYMVSVGPLLLRTGHSTLDWATKHISQVPHNHPCELPFAPAWRFPWSSMLNGYRTPVLVWYCGTSVRLRPLDIKSPSCRPHRPRTLDHIKRYLAGHVKIDVTWGRDSADRVSSNYGGAFLTWPACSY